MSGRVALAGPSGERGATQLEYSLAWLGLLAGPVERLSVQSHRLGSQWFRELGERWLFRIGGAGGLRFAGLESVGLLSYGLDAGAAITLDPGHELSSELEVRMSRIEGHGRYGYLSGTRLDARIEQRWVLDPVNVELGIGGGRAGLGSDSFRVSLSEFPGCSSEGCEGAIYHVPLGYAGPYADLATDVRVSSALKVHFGAAGEYRQYLKRSRIDVEARSRKTRGDWCWRIDARAELGLDESNQLALLLQYTGLGTSSNVDYDAADSEHDLDYGRYSFIQQRVEAGMRGSF